MEWGLFSLAHVISLIFAIALIIILHYSLAKRSTECKTIVLFVLSLFGVASIIYNLIVYHSPLEKLPLNVTEMGFLIMPFVIIFPRKGPANLLLLNVLAAVVGLIFNTAPEAGYFSMTSIFYYFPMVLAFGLPILIFTLDLSDLDIKYLPSTLAVGIILFTCVHFINIGINAYAEANELLSWSGEIVHVNYMATLEPVNAILKGFYNIIPHPYWYMSVGLVIDFIYLVLIYGIHNYVIRVRKTKEMED